MSRPIRLDYPGAVFHITCRGNERRSTFHDDLDREHFLKLLAAAVDRFGWIVTAYVLMSNHVHLVVELTSANLSRGMQWLNATYSQAFNRRHQRVGHLFQGRFKAFLIDKENYMLTVLRYVVLNPVRAGMVKTAGDYAWSSYRATAGDIAAPEWLATDDVLVAFGEDRALAQSRYREFVNGSNGDEPSPWDELKGQIFLGNEMWIDQVRERVQTKPRPDGHSNRQRNVGSPAMAEVVTTIARAFETDAGWIRSGHGGVPRMLAAWLGRYEAQLNLTEIAAGLRLRSAGHVSLLMKQCEDAISKDDELQARLDECVRELHSVWKTVEPKL